MGRLYLGNKRLQERIQELEEENESLRSILRNLRAGILKGYTYNRLEAMASHHKNRERSQDGATV